MKEIVWKMLHSTKFEISNHSDLILGYRCRSPPFIFSVIGIAVGADVGVHIDIDFCIQLIIISVMLISVVLHFVL